jgi:spore germination cell wall hydrolase CwlJ-like protein
MAEPTFSERLKASILSGSTIATRLQTALRYPVPSNPVAAAAPTDPHAMSDLAIVARTVWGEDRGGDMEGMEAVAGVIGNRVRAAKIWMNQHQRPHPEYGDGTFKGACLQGGQFTCWWSSDPNYKKMMDPQWIGQRGADSAQMIAAALVDGTFVDPTGGAVCYYAPAGVAKAPAWAGHMTCVANICGQLFFK